MKTFMKGYLKIMDKELWFDLTKIEGKKKDYISYIVSMGYTGIFIDRNCLEIIEFIPNSMKIIFYEENEIPKEVSKRNYIVATRNLEKLKLKKNCVCPIIEVKDKNSMEEAIKISKNSEYLLIDFEDSTNIPLELIVAFSQQTKCKVFKHVTSSEDGWIATMTMEEGSFGVLLSTDSYDIIRKLIDHIKSNYYQEYNLVELKVERIKHIGMGDRVCIDTISKLLPDEGMLIGSTSSGGILVSSENHYLPYMELRPFRVNAGAIHSYIFCENNTTKYLSELKAGDNVLVVNAKGKARIVAVGRIKMERRPMLLVECLDAKNTKVNVIVQDDWHIRIIGGSSVVRNATELKKGDTLLGIVEESGRHLGVKISETIIEK